MLHNYIKIAWRNLLKNRSVSLIMIFGLASSIAAFLLITQYVFFELSYDDFHKNADNLYRIRLDDYKNGALTSSSAISYYAEGPAMKEALPEIEDFVRLHRADGMISYKKKTGESVSFHEKKAFYADSSFFEVFSFPLIKGSENAVLRRPESVVISKSMAQKYFGKENPIGKTLQLSTDWQGGDYVVEGVFADIPANSHLHFDFVFSIQNLLKNEQFANGGWYWTNFYTYLLLKPHTLPKSLESRLASVIDTHLGRQLRRYNLKQRFVLQPVSTIHLYSQTASEVEANGKIEIVYLLTIVALLVLAIGWLNYINLATAKGIDRAKEVGIRKALGSEKSQLIKQFLFESFALNLVSMIIAVGLLGLILPFFDYQIPREIYFFMAKQPVFWIVVVGVFGVGFFLSGFYPAFILSRFHPIAILKGRLAKQMSDEIFRKALVVFQFTVSIVLIIASVVINQQVNFMQTQDLGMNIEQKLITKSPKILQSESYTNDIALFKNRVLLNTSIRNVTASSDIPGREIFWTNELQRFHEVTTDFKLCNILAVDEDFIPAYKMKLLAGRNFYQELVLDNNAIIINETALRTFGFSTPKSAINQEIGDVQPRKIVGVIKDFHQQSLKMASRPIVLYHIPWKSAYLTITLQGKDVRKSMAVLKETYQEVFPNNAFEAFFLNDYFQQQYESEERLSTIFSGFSLLAISIACLGLFGLALFSTKNRTKEIGIRKVMGASIGSIIVLLSKDFLKLVIFAIVLASPIAWYLMHKWLQEFAYKVDIAWWVFVLTGLLALAIALLTVSFQSTKAALMNPVKNLGLD